MRSSEVKCVVKLPKRIPAEGSLWCSDVSWKMAEDEEGH